MSANLWLRHILEKMLKRLEVEDQKVFNEPCDAVLLICGRKYHPEAPPCISYFNVVHDGMTQQEIHRLAQEFIDTFREKPNDGELPEITTIKPWSMQ